MKRLKKLLASVLIVASIVSTCSIASFATTDTQATQISTLQVAAASMPRGDLSGGIVTVSSNQIKWASAQGGYDSYKIYFRVWPSLTAFQSQPNGGTTFTRPDTANGEKLTDKVYSYTFTHQKVYRIWVYGVDGTTEYSIGGYEWIA